MIDQPEQEQENTVIEAPIPEVNAFSDKAKTYEYYQKIFTDPDLKDMDYVTAQQLYNSGKIKFPKFKSLVGKLDRAIVAGRETDEIKKFVEDPNQLKNPINADDRRKVDIGYAQGERLSVGNILHDEKIMNKVATYNGIVPQQLSRQFGALILSGSPEQQLHAAQLIAKLDRVSPSARIKNFGGEILNRADYINLLNYEGADIKEIINTVNEFTKPLDSNAKVAYQKEARDFLDNQTSNIKYDLRNSSVGVDTPRMIATYKKIYESVYRGNKDYATAITLKNIEGRFSASKFGVDANTVMETSPEEMAKIYKVPEGKQEEYVRNDLQKFVEPYGAVVWDHAGPIYSLLHGTTFDNKRKVYLEEDAKTDLDHSYAIKYIDRGMPVPLKDDNDNPLRYKVSKPSAPEVVKPNG